MQKEIQKFKKPRIMPFLNPMGQIRHLQRRQTNDSKQTECHQKYELVVIVIKCKNLFFIKNFLHSTTIRCAWFGTGFRTDRPPQE